VSHRAGMGLRPRRSGVELGKPASVVRDRPVTLGEGRGLDDFVAAGRHEHERFVWQRDILCLPQQRSEAAVVLKPEVAQYLECPGLLRHERKERAAVPEDFLSGDLFEGLDAALDVWEGVSMHEVRARSIELSELFIREVENRCPQLKLVSPRASENRGSQVSFAFEEGYAAMQALIAAGVIGDFRAPDVMRFGFTPLYIDSEDVMKAVVILEDIMLNKTWDRQEFKQRAAVT
jgi:hypothetical protein